MAKEHKGLSELPPKATQGFEEKYPAISEWLNGSVWELTKGTDFKVATETFYQSLKSYLKRTGREAEVGQRGTSIWVKARTGSRTARAASKSSSSRRRTKR